MPCSFRIISEMLPKIHTMEKCDFLKPIIHSQIIQSSVYCLCEVWSGPKMVHLGCSDGYWYLNLETNIGKGKTIRNIRNNTKKKGKCESLKDKQNIHVYKIIKKHVCKYRHTLFNNSKMADSF